MVFPSFLFFFFLFAGMHREEGKPRRFCPRTKSPLSHSPTTPQLLGGLGGPPLPARPRDRAPKSSSAAGTEQLRIQLRLFHRVCVSMLPQKNNETGHQLGTARREDEKNDLKNTKKKKIKIPNPSCLQKRRAGAQPPPAAPPGEQPFIKPWGGRRVRGLRRAQLRPCLAGCSAKLFLSFPFSLSLSPHTALFPPFF